MTFIQTEVGCLVIPFTCHKGFFMAQDAGRGNMKYAKWTPSQDKQTNKKTEAIF